MGERITTEKRHRYSEWRRKGSPHLKPIGFGNSTTSTGGNDYIQYKSIRTKGKIVVLWVKDVKTQITIEIHSIRLIEAQNCIKKIIKTSLLLSHPMMMNENHIVYKIWQTCISFMRFLPIFTCHVLPITLVTP